MRSRRDVLCACVDVGSVGLAGDLEALALAVAMGHEPTEGKVLLELDAI
jgi:hypothetical protein